MGSSIFSSKLLVFPYMKVIHFHVLILSSIISLTPLMYKMLFSVDSLGSFRYTIIATNTDNFTFLFPFFTLILSLPLSSNLLRC